MPIRIYEIAKELNVESRFVLQTAKELGVTAAKVPSSSLDRITAEFLKEKIVAAMQHASDSGLTAIGAKDFKAFAVYQRSPIRPITLVFGGNSSGKSSILHALLLTHEAMRTGTLDVSHTALGGDSVDLGGFRQFVHRRDAGRRVELSFELDPRLASGQAARLLGPCRKVKLTLSVGMPLDDLGQPLPGGMPSLVTFEVEADERSILRLSGRHDSTLQLDHLEPSAIDPVVQALLLSYTTTKEVDEAADQTAVRRAIADMMPELRFESAGLLPGRLLQTSSDENEPSALLAISKGDRAQDLERAARLFVPRAVGEAVEQLSGMLRRRIDRLAYLGPLRSLPPRHLAFVETRDPNWVAGGAYAWNVVKQNPTVRAKVNEWLSDAKRCKTPYLLEVQRFISPKQAQDIIAESFWTKLQEFETTRPFVMEAGDAESGRPSLQFTDFDGDTEATALIERLRDETRLDRFDELLLVDQRTKTIVSHRDVGIGISQVLPVLVHAYADKERLVAIEQPEIHLHPALQAELGDVFIQSALGEQRNTFLLETHSEHLILRLLRRVRETTEGRLPPGLLPIKPEDLSVLYVQPGENGAEVIEMPVTPDGDFGRPWPGGFFAERLEDLP